jgi:hypothetical protein
MLVFFRRQRRLHRALFALLVLAMLLAQSIGLVHRIIHADRQAAAGIVLSSVAADSSGALGDRHHHSCAAFDAATLADSLPTPARCTQFTNSDAAPTLPPAFRSWDAPFIRFFSSRAPPLA